MSGSPPVNRTRVTPSKEKMCTRRVISSYVSRRPRCSHCIPSSGIQYRQRKLHLSVTEMRRLVTCRPNVSMRYGKTRCWIFSLGFRVRDVYFMLTNDPRETLFEVFFFPDRNDTLHSVDCKTARFKRLIPVRSGYGCDNRNLANL